MATINLDANKQYIPTASTKGLWHLNGNSTDSSGNGNNGTDTDVTYSASYGKFLQGASYNGTTSKTALSTLGTVNANKTWGCWTKITSDLSGADSVHVIFQVGYGASNVRYFIDYRRISSVNSFLCYRDRIGVGGEGITFSNPTSAFGWYHLLVTLSGTTMTFYVNGVSVGSVTINTGSGSLDGGFPVLGMSYYNGSYVTAQAYTGYIDEALYEDTAWSASEVKEYYDKTMTRYFGEYLGSGSSVTKGLWHLNDNLLDASGNGKTLTQSGTVSFTSGMFGSGVSATWNGTNNLSVANILGANLGTGNITVSLWIKRNGAPVGNYTPIISCIGDGGNNRFYLVASKTTGYFYLYLYDGTNNPSVGSTKNICNNNWHNAIAIRNGSNMYIYVDGVFSGSAGGAGINIAGQNLYFGFNPSSAPSDVLDGGIIDELIVENVAWSAEKVRKYYTYAKGRFGI